MKCWPFCVNAKIETKKGLITVNYRPDYKIEDIFGVISAYKAKNGGDSSIFGEIRDILVVILRVM